ncbi:MAG: SIMPL domain-containing protein [Candidatus Falkowbacteria bacterium]
MENKNRLVLAMGALGLSLIVATALGAFVFYKVKSSEGSVLSVTGSADQIISSDTVKWTSAFSRNVAPDKLKDGNVQIATDLKTIMAYFKQSGVADNEITVNPVTISPLCDSQNNVIYDKTGNPNCAGNNISGYSLQESIIVESSRVNDITDLTRKSSDYLIAKGLVFSTQSLEYYYNKLADLRLELLTKATENAKERATRIAQSTGAKINFLQSAATGVFQVTAKNSVDVSDYGVYDTTSIDKKITAVVKASFSLK